MKKHCVAAARLARLEAKPLRQRFQVRDAPVAWIAAHVFEQFLRLRHFWMILPVMPRINFQSRKSPRLFDLAEPVARNCLLHPISYVGRFS